MKKIQIAHELSDMDKYFIQTHEENARNQIYLELLRKLVNELKEQGLITLKEEPILTKYGANTKLHAITYFTSSKEKQTIDDIIKDVMIDLRSKDMQKTMAKLYKL